MKVQSCRTDNDIGLYLRTRSHFHAAFGETFNLVGHNIGFARTQGGEKITVGGETHALIPHIVIRGQVLFDIETGRQFGAHALEQQFFGLFRKAAAIPEHKAVQQYIAPARQPVSEFCRQIAPRPVCQGVLRRHGDNIGWRTLQHGDFGGFFSHGRHQRDSGCARADNYDFFVIIIKVFGPKLRMDDRTFEVFLTRKCRSVALLVIVIAGAHMHETAGERFFLLILRVQNG